MNVTMPPEDEIRRLLAEAVDRLEPSNGALDAIRSGYAARRRVTRRRRWAAGGASVIAIAAGVAVALALVSTPQPRRQTLRVAAPTVDPAKALDAYAAGVPNVIVKSSPVAVGRDEIAVLAVGPSGNDHVVRVVSFASGEWQKVVDIQLPAPSFDFLPDPIGIGDVTSDGRPDFVVAVEAADNAPGVVVSDVSGTWKVMPLSPDPTDVYAERGPEVRDGHLVNHFNDCTPDCADGHTSDVVWTYSTLAGHFTPLDDNLAIARQVQGFYNAYNNILVTKSPATKPPAGADATPDALAFAQRSADLTDKLKAFVGGQFDHDPVICAQNISPDPVLVDTISVSGDTATATVHQDFGQGASRIKVTLRKSGALWQLDAVDCL
ncbi:MAG: hypothetical protein JOZ37_18705 [Actinobacteria bacterium]|nr:hypothetical protein [Actinomycetota bacterium]MBV9252814.1 hypothetical protein [Actinomycetota bacterium]MBV9666002.1 hypothetical protein [Actinomycetota bacterium]MBV9936162.1 hypothetical protein [Actinomycetota bacterium]